MANVNLAAGASGSNVTTSGQTCFFVQDGTIEISTDSGTTWIPFSEGEKFIMSDSLTVQNRNASGTQSAAFRYMAF